MFINRKLKIFFSAFIGLMIIVVMSPMVCADTEITDVNATASSYVDPYSPDKAVNTTVDPNISAQSSRWYCVDLNDKWLQLDLKKNYYIDKWHVENLGNLSWDSSCNTKDYELLGSADGTNWTTIQTITGNTSNTTDNTVVPFSARYVRLHITHGNQNNNLWASIVKFHVSAVSPVVSSCSVPASRTYVAEQNLDFTVNYPADVIVNTTNGIPYIPITIGSKTVNAEYLSGSGTKALTFRYTVQAGDSANGIGVGTSIVSNGGTINDYVQNSAGLNLNNVTTTGIIVDAAVPNLTSGAVNRTSDTESAIKFTSDEPGQYYYAVVEAGATAPTIDASAAGVACTTDETTISLTSMTAGAKDIYIEVKDAAGNVSSALKVNIPEYYAPTAPILDSTSQATSIGAETATIGGTVTADGGQSVTDRGVVYAAAPNPQLGGAGVTKIAAIPATGTGAYTIALTGLTPSTTYYAKSYASNSVGTSYGSEISFTTTAAPVTINSIKRESPSDEYTNAAKVTYRATFSGAVTGVTASNFDLNSTVTGASIVSVNPVGGTAPAAQWDITVNTGTEDGTITPKVINSTGISVGISSELPYIGEVYTIDKTTPTPIEISTFDPIPIKLAGSAIYADATEVIKDLPKNVTANNNTVMVPVSTWVDTDKYNPNVAGRYTFTATLGTIPVGYANSSNYTATVEVVVETLSPIVTAAPSEANITVINNVEGTPDIITVTGINPGDIVKVYDDILGGSLLGTGIVALGKNSVAINVAQLGVNAGNIYVTVTGLVKAESSRTKKAYAQEIRNSRLNLSTIAFDKNVKNQADIDVDVNFNGNTLTGISNGGNALINGTDYVVNGNVITIAKGYLSNQNTRNFVLKFNFSSGDSQTVTVYIADTTVTNTSGGGTTTGGNSTTSTRTVDVISGTDSTAVPVKVEITRTVESGTKIDTLKLDEAKITQIIEKTLAGNKIGVTIQITDPKDYFKRKTTIMHNKVDQDKEWHLQFTKATDPSTVISDNIYVTDLEGNRI